MIRTYLNGNGSLANIWMEIVVVDDICTHQLLNQSIEIEREIQCKYIAANRTEQNTRFYLCGMHISLVITHMNKQIISNTYIIHCYISHSQNVRYFFSQLHTRALRSHARKYLFIQLFVLYQRGLWVWSKRNIDFNYLWCILMHASSN